MRIFLQHHYKGQRLCSGAVMEQKLNIPLHNHQDLVAMIEGFKTDMGYHHYERTSAYVRTYFP